MFGNETDNAINTNEEEKTNDEAEPAEPVEQMEQSQHAENFEHPDSSKQHESSEQPESSEQFESSKQPDLTDQSNPSEQLDPMEPPQLAEQTEFSEQSKSLEQTERSEEPLMDDRPVTKTEPEFLNESFDYLHGLENMEHSPIPFTTPYKVKDPIILLERCDKIWETLKLIKDVQCVDNHDEENASNSEMSPQKKSENSLTRYITYQPVLNNGNTSLPNFKLAVKSMKKLFHCHICGKEYSENRSLRHHSFKIHGVIIPLKRSVTRVKSSTSTAQNDARPRRTNTAAQPENLEHKLIKEELINTELSGRRRSNTSDMSNSTKPLSARSRKKESKQEIKFDDNFELEGQLNIKTTGKRQRKVPQLPVENDVVCALCKRKCKCIQTHLKQYHKIQTPNIVMNGLKNMVQTETVPNKKLKLGEMCESLVQSENSTNTKQEEATKPSPRQTVQQQNVQQQNRRKRKYRLAFGNYRKRHKPNENANTGGARRRQCQVCQGVYSVWSMYKHMQRHAVRGETSENIGLKKIHYRYANSPHQTKNNSDDKSLDKSNNGEDLNNFTKNQNQLKKMVTRSDKQMTRNCECGRAFRNPHTFFLHKSNCKVSASIEMAEDIARHSTDRDSGIGISITIKKKNNSYEVVNRDSDEAKSKDSGNSDLSSDASDFVSEDCHNSRKNNTRINVDSMEYSTNHKILKLEAIDEDIDVDIEDESQNKNKPFSDKIPNDGSLKMRDLCRKILSEARLIDGPSRYSKCSLTCTCGRKYAATSSLNQHALKHHPLLFMCGYCNEKFSTIVSYNRHRCVMSEGGELVRPPNCLYCPTCNAKVRNNREYDSHVRSRHCNSTLPYQCYKCPKRFTSNMHRQVHYTKEHGTAPCSICEKKLHPSSIWMHEGYHFGLGYPCHTCKKAYVDKTDLTRHYYYVHNKEQNTMVNCTLCSREMKKKTFERHIYEHYDKEICRLCKSVFVNEEFLLNHIMLNHYDTYPMMKCRQCGTSFLNKSILNVHMKHAKCGQNPLFSGDKRSTISS